MPLPADEAMLTQVVGADTLRRGRDYARQGAVISSSWRQDSHVFGQVQGSRRQPYTAIAVVGKSPQGTLTSFHGTCSCPVGTNCKHTVALLLAALPEDDTSWERSLTGLVPAAAAVTEPRIGLLFELSPGRPGIGLRPVIPGRKGGWVRAGISWSGLGYLADNRGLDQAHLRLLGEIVALDTAGRSYYSQTGPVIWLESISSRRIWDLFAEAQALGLPLVQAGKDSTPVSVYREPAEVGVDLRRVDGSLDLGAHITAGGERLRPGWSMLLGDPAHGIAWWQTNFELRLAPLARPVDRAMRDFIERGSIKVPARDEIRFYAEYLPVLRRALPVGSSDPSVVLPEIQPPRLLLSVRHSDNHRLDIGWQWTYAVGDVVRNEPLWSSNEERAGIEAVTAAVRGFAPLFEKSPGGPRLAPAARLTGMDTIHFTTELLPRLLELPDLTVDVAGDAPDYRANESAPQLEFSGSEDGDWFDLAVTVTVDGQTVPFQELFVALSTEQSHLILPSGTYFSLDRPEFRELAELIGEARAMQDSPSQGLRLSRFQASLWEELDRLGVVSGQAAQWQQSVQALTAGPDERPVPPGLRADLRPYQRAGFDWLAFLFDHRLGGILADEMGLGKTVQTLALLCHARESTTRPFLVVAPTSVVPNWISECHRFAPELTATAISETRSRRRRGLDSAIANANIVVTSYTLFRLDYEEYAGIEWAGLVLDEAQFVKNHQSQGYRCAKKLPVPFKLAITGTPMENNLMELWSLLSITAPGLFANPKRFEEYYRAPIERNNETDRLALLRRRVKPLMLRRSKDQVAADLPDKQEQITELNLNPRHRRVYQTHLHRERQKVLGLLGDLDGNRFEIFRSLTLLRQASLAAGLIDPAHATVPSTKLDALMELLDSVTAEGHRTLVYSQFTRFLDKARQRLEAAGIEYCYLDGATRNRAAVLEKFKTGAAPVFLISLKAGGFGLNLTEADYCVLLDPWWNPATEAQAIDRMHRIGQTKKVMVYRLVAKDTIEDKVMALKAKKAALFGSVINEGQFASGKLTAAEIRGMLD